MGISDSALDEILVSLDNSAKNLIFLHLHEHKNWPSMKKFLDEQYETLLENLLSNSGTSIHHLKSGMKNRVIVRKHKLFSMLEKEYFKD